MEQIYIAIDLETTGLDAGRHTICQIGWTIFTATKILESDISDVYCSYSDIERASAGALKANGFTAQRLSDGVPCWRVLKALRADLMIHAPENTAIAVFQNAPFDMSFLKATNQIDDDEVFKALFRRVLDTVSLGFVQYRKLLSLQDLAKRYLVQSEIADWNKHDAKSDSIITARITQKIIDRLECSDLC